MDKSLDAELAKDLVLLLDLLDAIDWEAPKWHHMLATGALCKRIRGAIGATDRLPEERLHTNDEQVLDLAFKRLGLP